MLVGVFEGNYRKICFCTVNIFRIRKMHIYICVSFGILVFVDQNLLFVVECKGPLDVDIALPAHKTFRNECCT